jgi:peptidoglycan/xylan/chitin deacetylase (PgdA/CDA1 family)
MPAPFAQILARLRPEVLRFVDTDQPLVGLAIAGGPDVGVLETLRRHQARATFFLLGARAVEHPTLVRRVAEDGHELANATWDGTPTPDGIARTQGVLEPVSPPRFLRAGTWPSRSILGAAQQHGLRCVAASRRPRPGAIVELRDPTPEAVEQLLGTLSDRGLRPTTLDELVAGA